MRLFLIVTLSSLAAFLAFLAVSQTASAPAQAASPAPLQVLQTRVARLERFVIGPLPYGNVHEVAKFGSLLAVRDVVVDWCSVLQHERANTTGAYADLTRPGPADLSSYCGHLPR